MSRGDAAADVAARLDALREAGRALRARPARERLDALASALDGWSDAGSSWRKQLLETLPGATGFSRENVEEGLALALAGWRGDALRELVDRELHGVGALEATAARAAGGFDVTSLLLAGSIPMPTLLSMLAPLVLGSPVLVKCAARDPVTAPLVARSLAEVDAGLGACVQVVRFGRVDDAAITRLLTADCVVATGSDETIQSLRPRVAAGRRFVPSGHRLSLAVLGEAATRGEALASALRGIALDVSLWDQLGCLSPIAVYVVGDDRSATRRVGEALAAELDRAEPRRPRGRVETEAAARFTHERDAAELRAAAGDDVVLHAGDGFAVVCEADAAPRPAPLHRFVRVHPVRDERELARVVRPMARHLAGVALAAGDDASGLARTLARCGASRVCPPGRLQAPPLDWCHEGRGVLLPLARFTDFEIATGE